MCAMQCNCMKMTWPFVKHMQDHVTLASKSSSKDNKHIFKVSNVLTRY